jgi:multidrug transporter EmrE-like cation transporter
LEITSYTREDRHLKILQNPLALLLTALSLGAAGQIVLKVGMQRAPEARGIVETVRIILTQPYVMLGMAFYFLSSLLYLQVIQKWDLNLVYPMIAISYVMVAVLARILLHEPIPAMRVLGLVLICIGVSVMALSANGSPKRPASPAAASPVGAQDAQELPR